jgi:hypothetical protein
MAWEYEGLFDVIPDLREDLLSDYWRSEQTAIRIGSMGYRTRTTKAGTRLEAEVYPMFGRNMERTARKEKQNITKERQAQLNTRRAKHRLVLLVENNFRFWDDVAVTLTYKNEPEDEKRCRKDIRNFFNRVKRIREKRCLPELKYIYAIGYDSQHRIHAHCIMTGGIDRTELEQIWQKGYANTYSLQTYGNGLQGIANYLYKQNEKARDNGDRVNYHMWAGSRNLKTPKPHVSDCKLSNRKVKTLARYFRNEAKEIMEKIYPGYTLEEGEVRYSDIVDGVYIFCVMRKKEEADGRSEAGIQKVQPAHVRAVQREKQKGTGDVYRQIYPAAEICPGRFQGR